MHNSCASTFEEHSPLLFLRTVFPTWTLFQSQGNIFFSMNYSKFIKVSPSGKFADRLFLTGRHSETFLLQPTVSPLQICLYSLQTCQQSLGNSATNNYQKFLLAVLVLKHPMCHCICAQAYVGGVTSCLPVCLRDEG